jgi:hypothetical protein
MTRRIVALTYKDASGQHQRATGLLTEDRIAELVAELNASGPQPDEPRAHGGTIHATQVTASCSVDELRATLRYLGVEFHDHLNRIDTSGPFPSVVMPDREAETLCRELRSVGIAFNLRGTTLTNIPAR